ncbi:hypothetical protein GOBAR_AA15890 [Gossypium barbadense]|uniref:Uncharacterized protein n=1 Tax=Gossypium barbadense TaxID=3634 RepID=A0A2P5XN54_GOSBA|nr:hypothetical protein GOBAR_AA15890 [Gossypium barbadense]
MVRIREAGNRIVLVRRPTPTLVTEKSYACTTKQDELERVLSVIVGARIDQGSKYTSSGTDSLSLELDEVMDIDSLVGDTCKKHKTTSGAMRISYAKALSPKRFLPVNLPSFTPPISSLIIDADVTPSPTARISPLMHVVRGTPIRGNEGSFPWHGDLSAHEYPYNLDVAALRWQASILKAIRPSNTQLPSASSLCSFLHFLLSEANVVGLRYEEAHQKELANFKTESTKVSKQHRKMMKENKVILKQNEYLTECLAIVETKANRLEREVVVGKKSKEALQAELDRLTKEHVAETDRIIFVAGPFDVCKMDFDALEEVDISSLGFDVLCPSGYDSSSANLNIIARRFALANYFGGYGSLPANLNVTIGSFALTNCFEGCSSSLANLNTIVGALLSLTVWRLRLFACKP